MKYVLLLLQASFFDPSKYFNICFKNLKLYSRVVCVQLNRRLFYIRRFGNISLFL
ncbi:Uncharacterized protein PRO82_000955 [Candidatus Protochlamydia amoebophila]|nr:Uncharacterized protein [Candidatus Protochlamydia amoebophila]